jgi:hypothetical protein
MMNNSNSADCAEMCSPVRNRYFYGKMLDVFHFDLEQSYFNNKRWLLNRLVSGYGVVCGLNVSLSADGLSVVVSPGVAIDKCGREIIVCQASDPFQLPQPLAPPPQASTTPQGAGVAVAPTAPAGAAIPGAPANGGAPSIGPSQPPNPDCNDSGVYKHICICYHECLTDPSPALGGDCDTQSMCAPGSVRERYSLKLCDGKLCPAPTTTSLPNVISNGTLNYQALAAYVTNLPCCAPGTDCCIPLANIQIPTQPQTYTQNSIDISIRPLVYTADMLYELMLAWMGPSSPSLRGGKG